MNTTSLLTAPLEYVGQGETSLAVRRVGRGPAVILIAGFPLHGLTYRRLVPLLADEFTMYCVDLPGTGESRWTDTTDFSFPGHARLLMRMADVYDLKEFGILAHDSGASVARHLALLDRQRSRTLLLINTEIPHHRPPWIPLYQKLLRLPGSSHGLRVLLRSNRYLRSRAGFGGCFFDPACLDDEFVRLFVTPLVREHRKALGYARFLQGFDWAENDALATRHAEIRARTLLVWGRDDPTFPEPLGRAMARQFQGGAPFVSIPETRLLPHEEKPDEVAGIVRRFLLSESSISHSSFA